MIIVGEGVKKKLQFDMLKTLINADTQNIDKKHSGKFISNLTYDVQHITNLLSSAILNLVKDSLTLIGLSWCNVFSKLEACSYFFDNDTTCKFSIKKSWKKNGKSYNTSTRKIRYFNYLFG